MLNSVFRGICKNVVKDSFEIKTGSWVNITTEFLDNDKVRSQVFSGIITSETGCILNKNVRVMRIQKNTVVEKLFNLNSPKIKSISFINKIKKLKKSKLFFLKKIK